MEKILRSLVFLFLVSMTAYASDKPGNLTIEFLRGEEIHNIHDGKPEFGWELASIPANAQQAGYRILVASNSKNLDENLGDMWDSEKVESNKSINVEYDGKMLVPKERYFWKVKIWTKQGGESEWSNVQSFSMSGENITYATTRYPLVQTEVKPVSVVNLNPGHFVVDFGKDAFGYLKLKNLNLNLQNSIEVHFGESGSENAVNRNPVGKVRYYKVDFAPMSISKEYQIHPPLDTRNTGEHAIKLPSEFGVVAPFRYVEFVGLNVNLDENNISQVAVHYPFDYEKSSFHSDSEVLNQVWELCKYSMKATSFAGVYVDGDRERIPYEADAYINQLSHYAVDQEYSLARYSHEYLLENPTWPTEWKQHSVLMAWADYMYTGDSESVRANYAVLKSQKTLEQYAREDGLLNTKGLRDIVDWPNGERDEYDFRDVNTVVNAFYFKTLLLMQDLAEAVGDANESLFYRQKAAEVKAIFNRVLFDKQQGLYIDGEGSTHASLHANMFALAFGLVPEKSLRQVAEYVVGKGMACSVYGAQYLLEALYQSGQPEVALERMTSSDVRSWYNMIRVGSTITLEAWDHLYKNNLDWNHAWGAAPGNIISRYVLGVQPLEPGFKKMLICPEPGSLKKVKGKIPTIRGPVDIAYENDAQTGFKMEFSVPGNTVVRVGAPCVKCNTNTLIFDGKEVTGTLEKNHLFLDNINSGVHTVLHQCKAKM